MKDQTGQYVLVLILAWLGVAHPVTAQFRQREPTPNDTLVSPEVRPNYEVTFRIFAPKADEVSITGDWISQGLGTGGKLEKNTEGVWSITVGPLVPDFYSYSFSVDGVRTVDPKNAMIKQGIRSVDNMFFVPGEEAAFQDNLPVPHGEMRQVWYQSTTLGTQRRMHIYTPPGYDSNQDALPVLYLLHGGGDEDSGWSTIGRAGFILDNLLAAKRARPMLIVMPNGSMPTAARGEASAADLAARRAASRNLFVNELMNDVVPFVERSLRVQADSRGRAIAGLSMGGGQTLRVITSHPTAFAHVAIWSAGLRQDADEFKAENADFFRDVDELNTRFKILSISVGDRDFALEGSKNLAAIFEQNGIHHDLHVSEGGHTWINWRRYLHEYLPRLFQSRFPQ